MSQSPQNLNDAEEALRYGRAWLALNTLLRQGMSFSGRERNRCFLNIGSGSFANVSSVSGLDYLDDGRAVAAADWDFDGDLDVWTSNGTSPRLRYLSNDSPHAHHFIALRLQGTTSNRDAIGARAELYVSDADRPKRIKSLRAGDGFLSQSTKWIHFGLGQFRQIDRLVIGWPSGESEVFQGLAADQFWTIVQGSGRAIPYTPARVPELTGRSGNHRITERSPAGDPINVPAASQAGRVVLLNPILLPELQYHPLERPDESISLPRGRPLLLGLWATWCGPCIDELTQWTGHHDRLTRAGLSVLALCVDQPLDDPQQRLANVRLVTERLRIPFDVGIPDAKLVPFLDIAQRTFTPAQRPLPLPCSFLIDAHGRLAVVYKGPVSVDQVIDDSRLLDAESKSVLAAAIPFAGQWLEQPEPFPLRKLVLALYEAGQTEAAKAYVQQLILDSESDRRDGDELAQLYRIQGAMLADEKSTELAAIAFRNVLRFAPGDLRAHLELATLAMAQGDLPVAARHLTAAREAQPKDPTILKTFAALRLRQGQTPDAIALLRESLAGRDDPEVHFALANALVATRQAREAVIHLEEALRLQPGWPAAANNLAWLLATHSDESIRNGHRAVELANQACRATNHAVPEILLTYAAALAEVGQFDQALAVVQSAISLADQSNDVTFITRAQSQLARYRERQPLRSNAVSP